MKIAVKNLENKDVSEIEVPDSVFSYPYKEHLIHLVVEAIRAARRAGTHSTKRRSEVAGSGRKLWRQKGTGRARVGSIRSPLWRKGGVVHGPKPRNYEKDISVNEKKSALKSALSRKLEEGQIVVLDNFDLSDHKTAALARSLSGLGVGSKALLVDNGENINLARAARNNPNLKTVDALGVNVYDVVDRNAVIFTQAALSRLVEVLER